VEQSSLWNQADTYARRSGGRKLPYYWWPWGGFWLNPANPNPNPALGTVVKTFSCPADSRTLTATTNPAVFGLNGPVAFTAYVAVSSGTSADFYTNAKTGISYWGSKIKMAQITNGDGTSNTAMVGERPPSTDLDFGWWFAGAGWDGSGTGDVLLGAREYNYASSLGCPSSKVGLQPGNPDNPCDQVHFWSMHTGGANFLMADGRVRFVVYAGNGVLPAMCTWNGGEAIDTSNF
jgi:prepilin-type processing-associated H-X9-DG protein